MNVPPSIPLKIYLLAEELLEFLDWRNASVTYDGRDLLKIGSNPEERIVSIQTTGESPSQDGVQDFERVTVSLSDFLKEPWVHHSPATFVSNPGAGPSSDFLRMVQNRNRSLLTDAMASYASFLRWDQPLAGIVYPWDTTLDQVNTILTDACVRLVYLTQNQNKAQKEAAFISVLKELARGSAIPFILLHPEFILQRHWERQPTLRFVGDDELFRAGVKARGELPRVPTDDKSALLLRAAEGDVITDAEGTDIEHCWLVTDKTSLDLADAYPVKEVGTNGPSRSPPEQSPSGDPGGPTPPSPNPLLDLPALQSFSNEARACKPKVGTWARVASIDHSPPPDAFDVAAGSMLLFGYEGKAWVKNNEMYATSSCRKINLVMILDPAVDPSKARQCLERDCGQSSDIPFFFARQAATRASTGSVARWQLCFDHGSFLMNTDDVAREFKRCANCQQFTAVIEESGKVVRSDEGSRTVKRCVNPSCAYTQVVG